MKIKSLTDYFSSLHNRSLGIFLSSVMIATGSFYLGMSGKQFATLDSPMEWILCFLAFMDGLISFYLIPILLRKKIQPITELDDRLYTFGKYNFVHFAILFVGSLLIIAAFYFSGNRYILLVYALYLILFYYAWPTRLRASSDLALAGDERESVLNSKE